MSNDDTMWNLNKKFRTGIIFLILSLMLGSCILLPDDLPEQTATVTNTPTAADVVIPPTATQQEPTLVSTTTSEPVDTATPLPTNTYTPQPTDEPTSTPLPTHTTEPTPIPFLYQIQSGTPAYIKNFTHPAAGCDWLGVAGQIFDENGFPVLNLVALVSGKYGGNAVDVIGVSGTGDGDNYGPGGFEIVISDNLIATSDQLSIQLFDLNGLPVSDMFYFDTFNNCDKNLVIINFVSNE